MEIVILGSGTTYGTPACFNNWGSIKNISNPKNTRTRASTYLKVKNKSFIVDLTPEFRIQVNDNNIKDLDAVFLTHGHHDHIASIPELQRAAYTLNKTINVFCGEDTFADVKKCFFYMFKNRPEKGSEKIIWNVISDNEEFEFEGVKWQTFQVKHGNMSTTAFRHENIAIVMDLEELTEDNKKHLQNLDLLMIECNNGYDKVSNGHNNLYNVLEWVEELQPRKTLLTHIGTRVDHEEVSKTLNDSIEIAYDGMRVNL